MPDARASSFTLPRDRHSLQGLPRRETECQGIHHAALRKRALGANL